MSDGGKLAGDIARSVPVVGQLFGGIVDALRGPDKPKYSYANTGYTRGAYNQNPLKGEYGSLAPGRGIEQAYDPWIGYQGEGSDEQRRILEAMLARAGGADSIAAQRGLEEQRSLQAAVMGQAASTRGRYNPGLQNMAGFEASLVPSGMSADLEAAKAKERLGALQAFQSGSAQLRGQDLSAEAMVRSREEMERQRALEREQQRQAFLKMQQQSDAADIAGRSQITAIATARKAAGLMGDTPGLNYRKTGIISNPFMSEEEKRIRRNAGGMRLVGLMNYEKLVSSGKMQRIRRSPRRGNSPKTPCADTPISRGRIQLAGDTERSSSQPETRT